MSAESISKWENMSKLEKQRRCAAGECPRCGSRKYPMDNSYLCADCYFPILREARAMHPSPQPPNAPPASPGPP